MIVTLIGVSGLLAVRIQRRAAGGAADAIRARRHARSAVELALLEIQTNDNWYGTYVGRGWTSPRPLGKGTLAFKIVDAAEPAGAERDRLRLTGRGACREAMRKFSVLFEAPPEPPNLLENPGMEDSSGSGSLASWTVYASDPMFSSVSLSQDNNNPHSGDSSMRIEEGVFDPEGAGQVVTDQVKSDTIYRFEAWVRFQDDADTARIVLESQTSSGITSSSTIQGDAGTGWSRVSGELTTPSGTLEKVRLLIPITSYPYYEWIDDASLRVVETSPPRPVPGSWRREVN